MARTYARMTTATAEDADWCQLAPLEQWLYMTLLRLPKLSLAGCVDVKLKAWSRLAGGITEDQLTELLERLAAADFIAWDSDTDEIVIRTFVKNDGVLANRNLGKGMWTAWAAIESQHLRRFVLDNLPDEAWDPKFEPKADRPEPSDDDPGTGVRTPVETAVPTGVPEGQEPGFEPSETDPENHGSDSGSNGGSDHGSNGGSNLHHHYHHRNQQPPPASVVENVTEQEREQPDPPGDFDRRANQVRARLRARAVELHGRANADQVIAAHLDRIPTLVADFDAPPDVVVSYLLGESATLSLYRRTA